MTRLAEPACSVRHCKHFRDPISTTSGEIRMVCDAYPKGIPHDIAYGADLHLVKRADQSNDIVFEEMEIPS